MKVTILQGLKRVKHIDRKIKKKQDRIKKWCSYFEPDDLPVQYDVAPLIQSVTDLLKERQQIRHALHLTNALHKVIYKGKSITIDELLLLRIEPMGVIPERINTQRLLRRKEQLHYQVKDDVTRKVILQYNPRARDKVIDQLENELEEIDTLLDEINISVDISEHL